MDREWSHSLPLPPGKQLHNEGEVKLLQTIGTYIGEARGEWSNIKYRYIGKAHSRTMYRATVLQPQLS